MARPKKSDTPETPPKPSQAALRGGQVVMADRWFASSKTCSGCGHKLEVLPLSARQWTCPECGANHDRDVNAAISLKQMAESSAGDSLWRGRRWLGLQDPSETGLCEAGSKQ